MRKFPHPDNPFGMTCPVLMVAKKHDVDYGVALAYAHIYAFGENTPSHDHYADAVDIVTLRQVQDDIATVYA